jgi:hypothetical protein
MAADNPGAGLPVLWHYTCRHSARKIGPAGILYPAGQLLGRSLHWPGSLVWLTDLPTPNRDALGLTSHALDCDRTEHRYRATDTLSCRPYTDLRRALPDDAWRLSLETAPGARLRHWWVSLEPVPVVLDERRVSRG